MIEIYYKKYDNKVIKEVSYYFVLNNRGAKKYYEVIYEMISDFDHYYSKYVIELKGEIRYKEEIENNVIKYVPILLSKIRGKRRLSVLAKFILYIISIVNNTSIYKLPERVVYYNNGNEILLSSNAFVKSSYKLLPLFEQIYKE
jgi:hypothetical protein